MHRRTWAYFANPINVLFTCQLVMFALIGALWMAIVNDPSRSNLIIERDIIKDRSGGPPSFTSNVLLTQVSRAARLTAPGITQTC